MPMLRPQPLTFWQSAVIAPGSARFGRRAADFLCQDGGAYTAAAGRVEAVLHGHVVVDHHGFYFDAFGVGHFGGHLEVHNVAGVVLDDVQHACAAVNGLGGLDI